MELQRLDFPLTVCKLSSLDDIDLSKEFYFIGRTDEELSLVCKTGDAPGETLAREDGWRGFRVCGTLDFSLVGILSALSGVLAENRIGLFAVSTYNTDYILVREHDFDRAVSVLEAAGHRFV